MATEADSLTITAPATSANLGPGFDVLALSGESVHLVVHPEWFTTCGEKRWRAMNGLGLKARPEG